MLSQASGKTVIAECVFLESVTTDRPGRASLLRRVIAVMAGSRGAVSRGLRFGEGRLKMGSKYPRRAEPDPSFYLTEQKLAERLGCNRDTLYELRRQGRIPYMRVSNRIVYRIKDLERIEAIFMNGSSAPGSLRAS
jgi:excisionase family DNA binding protein